jgi:hypothetical protein
MGYVTIATRLVSLLGEISGLTAYDHEPKELGSYPCATVQAAGHRNRFNDTAANLRQYSFAIRLFYDDRIPLDLEANVVAAGVWDLTQPTEAVWLFAEREVPVRIAEITIDIKVRVNRAGGWAADDRPSYPNDPITLSS